MADYVLERLEDNVPPIRLRTLVAALPKIGCQKFRLPWRVLEANASMNPPTQATAMPYNVFLC